MQKVLPDRWLQTFVQLLPVVLHVQVSCLLTFVVEIDAPAGVYENSLDQLYEQTIAALSVIVLFSALLIVDRTVVPIACFKFVPW